MDLYQFIPLHSNSVQVMNDLNRAGLQSPSSVYKKSRSAFVKRVLPVYAEAARAFWRRRAVTATDVLSYLNQSINKPLTADTILLSSLSHRELSQARRDALGECVEVTVKDAEKHLSQPIVVDADRIRSRVVTWQQAAAAREAAIRENRAQYDGHGPLSRLTLLGFNCFEIKPQLLTKRIVTPGSR